MSTPAQIAAAIVALVDNRLDATTIGALEGMDFRQIRAAAAGSISLQGLNDEAITERLVTARQSINPTSSGAALPPPAGSNNALKQNGVFSDTITGATPKYAKWAPRNDGYRDTMARLYIIPTPSERKKLKEMLGTTAPARVTQLFSEVLAGGAYAPKEKGETYFPPNTPGKGYISFLLQGAQHSLSENVEVIETLGDTYAAYTYGAAAPKFQYQVALLNTKQDDQATNFYLLYWNLLRATRLAHLQMNVYFQYDRMLVKGIMTDFAWIVQAQDESYCQGSFSLLVQKIKHFPETGFSDTANFKPTDDAVAGITGRGFGTD